jgi:hypothetical protein
LIDMLSRTGKNVQLSVRWHSLRGIARRECQGCIT